ncbi:hypothetical protein [Streptomyces mirabilis]|uniref:hypothetical protein n=1 Tax=Streptomyces mirabilis TaxID=68239 RepID=UPI003331FE88
MIGTTGEHPAVAGVAAVVGAAIGGGLAGLTAVGASWFRLRVARLQSKAQETEAARQRRFESLRERREPRSKAYADLLDGGQEVLDLSRSSWQSELVDRIESVNASVRKRRATVAIVGPKNVAQAAADLARAVAAFRNAALHLRPETPRSVSDVEVALELFTRAARAALEDDGDGPPGSE